MKTPMKTPLMKTQSSTTPNSASPDSVPSQGLADAPANAVDDRVTASEAALECFRKYAQQRPESVALWALGIGFVVGWKLKPW